MNTLADFSPAARYVLAVAEYRSSGALVTMRRNTASHQHSAALLSTFAAEHPAAGWRIEAWEIVPDPDGRNSPTSTHYTRAQMA